MNLENLNGLSRSEAKEVFSKCCGSGKWVEMMIDSGPFRYEDELLLQSESIWNSLSRNDWLEAFMHHPKIGDINSLKEKFTSTKDIAEKEQSGINTASEEVIKDLVKYNSEYEKKFGFIFIVCATGKTADEMLAMIQERIKNSTEIEIKIAMTEQNKITNLRLKKLL